jgi:hypothetical protein
MNKTTIEVLKFWHKVEFFVPFDLDEVLSRENARYCIMHSQLEQGDNKILPWLSPAALRAAGGVFPFHYEYNLYLLPFNKNELTRISQQVFPVSEDPIKKTAFEEKLNDDGTTCFAKLRIDSKGKPSWDTIALSTMPWAMGRLENKQLDKLNFSFYQAEFEKLKKQLNLLDSHLNDAQSELVKDHVGSGALTCQGINFLFFTLAKWSGFLAQHPLAFVVELIKCRPPKEEEETAKKIDQQILLPEKIETDSVFLLEEEIEEDNAEEKIPKQEPLSILNSFYIEDLEKVINSVSNKKHPILQHYINGVPEKEKKDLYQLSNHFYIKQKLHPLYTNQGKWPTADQHLMSLMQQFAINEVFQLGDKSALFSVNGPPGTGKTTLLQEIVAENITKRAAVLAELSSAKAAFTERISINIVGKTRKIQILNEKLTGFEMLVVSSNNAAVENISKELPLKRKLADKYQANCQYLTSVAAKVFAKHEYGKIKPLKDEAKPWGLLSVALGNTKNRNEFRDRVFFRPEKDKKEAEPRVAAKEYLNVWEWQKHYKGPTFREAQVAFKASQERLTHYLENIKHFVALDESLSAIDTQTYYQTENKLLEKLQKNKVSLNKNQNKISTFLNIVINEKNRLTTDIEQQRKFKPNWIQTLFRLEAAKKYERHLTSLEETWNILISKEKRAGKLLNRLDQKTQKNQAKILQTEKELAAKKHQYEQLVFHHQQALKLLPKMILLSANANLEQKEAQLQAFWQNAELNELRAQLFIAALSLHEAWLAEVMRSHSFSQNLLAISDLLQKNRTIHKELEKHIWQSFFMWMPVISSTFASVATQFKNLGAQTIGWLLIDEAGQATPQSAVGALWRAKKVLVVGDPLQIEPVFTIPANLVEGLARHSLSGDYARWLPTNASVQTLADAANPIGAFIQNANQRLWIGCPLRVHRRCLEPMFSIANQIAYNDKMINARVETLEQTRLLPESVWYNIVGAATDKQFVPEQGQYVLKLVMDYYSETQQLPNWFIITPFKRIKQNLQQLVTNTKNWQRYFGASKLASPENLHKWAQQYIGTVHTFQGKEANSVIFVLGLDENLSGAANWASSTPNLLNVALTRAQDRVYIIGNYSLWSRKPYFSVLAQTLPVFD